MASTRVLGSTELAFRGVGGARSVVARVVVAAVLAALGVACVPSLALADAYLAGGSFGGSALPLGVAVNGASGDVYVADGLGAGEIKRFDSSDSQVGSFSGGSGLFTGVAVDPTDSDVYGLALDFGGNAQVLTFNADGSPDGALAIDTAPCGAGASGSCGFPRIAADAAGNVYFPNFQANVVQKYSPAGLPLATIAGTGANALSGPVAVAVDSTGDVYVLDGVTIDGGGSISHANARVQRFDSAGVFEDELASGDVKSVGVDTGTDRVFVGLGADQPEPPSAFHVEVFDDSGAQIDELGAGDFDQTPFAPSIAANPATGRVYASDPLGAGSGGQIETYDLFRSPTATTENASGIGQSAATVHGSANPSGRTTVCQFQYGTSTAYGQSAPCTPGVGSGTSDVDVTATLSGLEPDTTYHYRVRAINHGGVANGVDQTFTTDPAPPVDPPPGNGDNGGNGGGSGAGASTPPPTPPAGTPPPAKGALAARALGRVTSGKARLRLTCRNGACPAGRIALKARFKTANGKRVRTYTIGTARFRALAAGETATVAVRLTRKARRALAKAGRIKATVTGATSAKVTLKAKRPAKNKARRTA